jgi:hypothetical protein
LETCSVDNEVLEMDNVVDIDCGMNHSIILIKKNKDFILLLSESERGFMGKKILGTPCRMTSGYDNSIIY